MNAAIGAHDVGVALDREVSVGDDRGGVDRYDERFERVIEPSIA